MNHHYMRLIGPHCIMVPVCGECDMFKNIIYKYLRRADIVIYIDSVGWSLNMPNTSLSTCHLEFIL